ncbi:MAG: four helix bundle protein [Candidatus Saccharibacteria bacterium]|nr:four helix bundle protein [Candidatus Saccharibacteria bacterium]
MGKSFKDLKVWQKSIDLAESVYRLCGSLPSSEKYGLCFQMQRCAVSVASNIAEGSKRRTSKDFHHFVSISKGSTAELETQLVIANRVHELDTTNVIQRLIEVQKMLEKLDQSLLRTKTND